MAENANSEPDNRDSGDPEEAREPCARSAGQPNDGAGQPNDGAGQSENCAAEDDDQRPGKATSDTYQIFGKEFRDSQVEELDALLSSLGEDIEGLRETKDQMVEALLAIPGSLPGTNLDEAAEAAAKAVEKRQEDFISRLEELRGDIAEEVDFAKWRHELADDRDRRSGKGDDGTAPFE